MQKTLVVSPKPDFGLLHVTPPSVVCDMPHPYKSVDSEPINIFEAIEEN
jgi:hypothetical protein